MKGALGDMMKKAQEMQANMQKAQAELASKEVTGDAGGGIEIVQRAGEYAVEVDTIKHGQRHYHLENHERMPIGIGP